MSACPGPAAPGSPPGSGELLAYGRRRLHPQAGQACAWLGVIARRKGPEETETAFRGRVGGWPDTRRPPLRGCGRLASHYDASIQQRRGASLEALSVQVTDG